MNEADPTSPRVPFRLVLLSSAGLWLCYFIVVTMRSLVMGMDFSWPLLWRRFLVALISIAVTLAHAAPQRPAFQPKPPAIR